MNAADVTEITQLIVRERESRDMGFWNRMRACFHPDSVVSISWYQGDGYGFVEGSRDMAARGMLAKHRLGPILVTQNGDRAIATLSAIIDIPTEIDGKYFTLSSHCLMLYRTEKRDGAWRIMSFEAIYRRDEFIPAVMGQSAHLPADLLAGFRPSYRNLSYSLHLKRYHVDMDLPGEDRPHTVKAIYERLYDWLGLPVPD